MAEFSDKGTHCSDPYCRQFDFLPFTCDFCKKVFCLEHFKPQNHECTNSVGICVDRRVIVCPICGKGIPIMPGAAADLLLEQHEASSNCIPAEFSATGVIKKKRCPAKGCKEFLTVINTFECKKCGIEVCMKHRLDIDHNCLSLAPKSNMNNTSGYFSKFRSSTWKSTSTDTQQPPRHTSSAGSSSVGRFLKSFMARKNQTNNKG